MKARLLLHTLVGTSLLGLASHAAAQSRSQTFLDVQAGLGYSSNPDLRPNGNGSGFGRLSAYGYHGWSTERSYTGLSAYVENSTYFKRYGNRQVFSLRGDTTLRASENVTLNGNLGFSGDFGAQLSSRLYSVPQDLDPNVPVAVIDPPLIIVSPDLTNINRRSYRLNGGVGLTAALSPRDSLSAQFGAARVFSSGDSDDLNYNQFDVTAGYQRQLNERTSVGIQGISSYAEYNLGRSVLIYGPQLTAGLQLAEQLEFRGALGFVRTELDGGSLGGKDSSTDLAADLALCRRLEYERVCVQAGRRAQSSTLGVAPVSTTISADYYRQLNSRDQIQASLGFVTTGRVAPLGNERQNFYTAAASFDRKVNQRLSAGVSVVARKLNTFGPDPKADVGGSLFIRNRFGSIR